MEKEGEERREGGRKILKQNFPILAYLTTLGVVQSSVLICTYTRRCVYMQDCVDTNIYIYIYTHTHTHTHI